MQLIRCRNKQNKQRGGAHSGKKSTDLYRFRKKKARRDTSPKLVTDDTTNNHYLSIGDYICLYCEDSQGYVFSHQTSSVHNSISIYNDQSRERPLGVSDPRAVVFRVCIQNRFKLGKKYRQLLERGDNVVPSSDEDLSTVRANAKEAAEAEIADNISEQKMNDGRRLRYGEVIQLQHRFTEKFVHISPTQTSHVDVNNRLVTLEAHNAKHAQFRILPRYKVRSIGESVQVFDQIILESVKAPGNYLHASPPSQVDALTTCSELNLGGEMTRFTVVLNCRPHPQHKDCIKGGSVIRLFHKDLEAYLVAEGLFDEQITEDVHLRIREKDLRVPRTLQPSTSSITYWQIEAEHSILAGGPLYWQQQVRFRHMCTRQYLVVRDDMHVGLTPDVLDPKTVFRLHPLLKDSEEIRVDSYVRIQHVLTSSWLHELRGEAYDKLHRDVADHELTWDDSSLRRIRATRDRKYQDAFTLQPVRQDHLHMFSQMAGMVPFLVMLLEQKQNGALLNAKHAAEAENAFIELKEFMIEDGVPTKPRQKLLRNLRILDMLVRLLQLPLEGQKDEGYMVDVFRRIYDVLLTYLHGHSNKNCLYFAKYITFFQSQMTIMKGDIGLTVVSMLVQLIRDNPAIIHSLTRGQIDYFVAMLEVYRHPHFLDLLGVLCVCHDGALVDNQIYITQTWLEGQQEGMLLTERGQTIDREANVIYISTDKGRTWTPMHEFVNDDYPSYDEALVSFLEHQLDLFGKLCSGRNQYTITKITRDLGILTWEEAFICLREEALSDSVRAMYCKLIRELFINVGQHYPVVGHHHCCTVYDDVDVKHPGNSLENVKGQVSTELDAIFPTLDEWIRECLDSSSVLIAREPGRNAFITQVLHMLRYLVTFGFYSQEAEMHSLQHLLLNVLDGRTDKPFFVECLRDKKKGQTRAILRLTQVYTEKTRFERGKENDIIMEAKYQGLEIFEILLDLQERIRLRSFVALFKQARQSDTPPKVARYLRLPINEEFDPFATDRRSTKDLKHTKKLLNQMFERNNPSDDEQFTGILMDLSRYKHDKLMVKALAVLNSYFSAKRNMFINAAQGLILTRVESVRVHREVVHLMPKIKRLLHHKMDASDISTLSETLDSLINFLNGPPLRGGCIEMQQNIMINHGVVEFVLDILSKLKIDPDEDEDCSAATVLRKSANILKTLVNQNDRAHGQIIDNIDMLLGVECVASEVAETLVKVFSLSTRLCIRIHPKCIEKIVKLAASTKVPMLVSLLCVLVKPSDDAIPLKRNQIHVIKNVMHSLSSIAQPLELGRESREQLFLGNDKKCIDHVERLTELLATCAQGDNRFIESICNSVVPFEENLWVLAHPDFTMAFKRPFIKFLHNVYLKTMAIKYDHDILEICHNRSIWIFLEYLADDIAKLNKYTQKEVPIKDLWAFTSVDPGYDLHNVDSPLTFCKAMVHLLFDAALPILKTLFTTFPMLDDKRESPEFNTVCYLSNELLTFSYTMKSFIVNPAHLKTLVTSMAALLSSAAMHESIVVRFLTEVEGHVSKINDDLLTEEKPVTNDEIAINHDFKTFTKKYRSLYEGPNSVFVQINYKNKWSKGREYVNPESEEQLPLGEEFQHHVKCFMVPSEKSTTKQYAYASKIIQYLGISGSLRRLPRGSALDIKCLEILRAMIHNEIVKLPADWDKDVLTSQTQLQKISAIQKLMVDEGVVANLIPLLGSKDDDIFRETLALLCSLLFNANTNMQNAIMKYFQSSREEVFFAATRARVESAMMTLKDRRSQLSKERAMYQEVLRCNGYRFLTNHGQKILARIDNYSNERKKPRSSRTAKDIHSTQSSPKHQRCVDEQRELLLSDQEHNDVMPNHKIQSNHTENTNNSNSTSHSQAHQDLPVSSFEDKSLGRDDGNLGIILKLLAKLCDGQHRALQNYLRDQPSNLKMFNLVAATVSLLNPVYSNIDSSTIALVIQIFDTLNEFTSGCQANRQVLLSNKIIDHINFILRAPAVNSCTTEQMHDLYQVIGNLLYTLVEENGEEELAVAHEVKDTVDISAIVNMMCTMYNKRDSYGQGDQEDVIELGFTYYIVYARLYDIDPTLLKTYTRKKEQIGVISYYKSNSMSVEIVKDGNLQKVNFRVLNKRIVREEIKEKVKWAIDRTSPSNRIRDFMAWAADIIDDAKHQKKIMANWFALFITEKWLWWNYSVIALSVMINFLMLLTWDAALALDNVPSNATALPPELHDPIPVIMYAKYVNPLTMVLGVLHNVMSLLSVIAYFIANHPRLPDIKKRINNMLNRLKPKGSPTRAAHRSRLDVHMFSFTTFYSLLILGMSLAGTTFTGYMFAFHLLHIVNLNHLLQGVIKALTKNGKSLLWVAVLGLVVFYLYALVAFAFMRELFDPTNDLYCATLWQCTVTIIRYGLIGDYEKKFHESRAFDTFPEFSWMTIYQVTFFIFITTIGLNVIFGIIVDTFSEHRERKWAAEADMLGSCFICGRPNYDFEHHSQGFMHHVKNEHNMWAYIFYLIHLEDTKINDYTALDLYVSTSLAEGRYGFFPINMAMCLAEVGTDQAEAKLDTVMNHVQTLVHKQREKELERKLKEEYMHQQRWQEKHRHRPILPNWDSFSQPDQQGEPDVTPVQFNV